MPETQPVDESERLAALLEYQILDTPSEDAFDDLARLAAIVCNAPAALVSFIDDRRQWIKARFNFDLKETPRDGSFCQYTICQPNDVFVVEDAANDCRFTENPLVSGKPRVGFYAAAPLVSHGGYVIGSIGVIDYKSRRLTANK